MRRTPALCTRLEHASSPDHTCHGPLQALRNASRENGVRHLSYPMPRPRRPPPLWHQLRDLASTLRLQPLSTLLRPRYDRQRLQNGDLRLV